MGDKPAKIQSVEHQRLLNLDNDLKLGILYIKEQPKFQSILLNIWALFRPLKLPLRLLNTVKEKILEIQLSNRTLLKISFFLK